MNKPKTFLSGKRILGRIRVINSCLKHKDVRLGLSYGYRNPISIFVNNKEIAGYSSFKKALVAVSELIR